MNHRTIALATLCGLALAAPATAQRALDHNLQVGSGGVNSARPDFAAEVRFRNAIVTGNAPAGFSFRGDVGYRAPGELQVPLAGDSTFTFRRDAAYSGLGGQGIRGTDALQYQFAMTTGNAPPQGMGVNPEFLRAGARSTSGAINTQQPSGQFTPRGPSASQLNVIDEGGDRGLSLVAMRSPSSFDANRGLQPALLGIVSTGRDQQPQGMTASPLRGIAYEPWPPARDTQAEPGEGEGTSRNPASPTQKPETRPGQKPETRPASPDAAPDTGINTAAPSTESDLRLNTAIRSPYDELIDRLRKDAAEGTKAVPNGVPTTRTEAATGKADKNAKEAIPDWQRRLDELRKDLTARPGAAPGDNRLRTPGAQAEPGDQNEPGDKSNPDSKGDKGDKKKGEAKGDKNKSGDKKTDSRRGINSDTVDMIRRAGADVAVLAPPGFDAYATQMQAGQEHLAAGRFFDAEERFSAALSAKNGDPMAAVGRVHAELGAGMFMSAAINLKALFTAHPEVVGIHYAPELLPSKERQARVMQRLQDLASDPERGREPAMLMAYLAYQSGDKAATVRALDLMGNPGERGAPAEGDDLSRLQTLLRGVWLAPDQPARNPAPAAPQNPDMNK